MKMNKYKVTIVIETSGDIGHIIAETVNDLISKDTKVISSMIEEI